MALLPVLRVLFTDYSIIALSLLDERYFINIKLALPASNH